MSHLNRVTLIGRIGKDPEFAMTQGGQAKCRLSVGTTRSWKNKETGEREEETEWSRVVVWGPLAEQCNKFLVKGRLVCVEGRLKTTSYDDKECVKRWSTDIIADTVLFLDKPDGNGGEQRSNPNQERGQQCSQPSQQRQSSNPNDSRKDGGKPVQTQASNDNQPPIYVDVDVNQSPSYGDDNADLIPF